MRDPVLILFLFFQKKALKFLAIMKSIQNTTGNDRKDKNARERWLVFVLGQRSQRKSLPCIGYSTSHKHFVITGIPFEILASYVQDTPRSCIGKNIHVNESPLAQRKKNKTSCNRVTQIYGRITESCL